MYDICRLHAADYKIFDTGHISISITDSYNHKQGDLSIIQANVGDWYSQANWKTISA